MHPINDMLMRAGLVIKPELEISESKEQHIEAKEQITEAKHTPRKKTDLKIKDRKAMRACLRGLTNANKHIKSAINALDKIPSTDFDGTIPHFIGELEDLLGIDNNNGLEDYLEKCTSELRKFEQEKTKQSQKVKKEEEFEELSSVDASLGNDEEVKPAASPSPGEDKFSIFMKALPVDQQEQLLTAMDVLKKLSAREDVVENDAYDVVLDITGERLFEAMHYFNVNYNSHEEDKDKPINVVDGTSNSEQVYDEQEEKNESPAQLRTMDQQDNSPVDKAGTDLSNVMDIPKSILTSLKDEITKAKSEAKKLDTRDKDASYFYNDLARAFEDLYGHLEKGTIYDFKQAQVFAQTLMGPMLHKIPTNVWKFLTNGGETRSLKSYMTDVSKKYPIIGPRNTIK